MEQPLHASAVAFNGQAILILGKSGSGKSTLAWGLIGLGGTLVADDRVEASSRDGRLWLDAPKSINGLIEARGLGVLKSCASPAWAAVVVNMDRVEEERIPVSRQTELLSVTLPLVYKVESVAFPVMLKAYLEGGVQHGDQ